MTFQPSPSLFAAAAELVATRTEDAAWPLKFDIAELATLASRMESLSDTELLTLARVGELLAAAAEVAASERINKSVSDEIAEIKRNAANNPS